MIRRRSSRGNMLAMIAATAILLVAALLFGLQFLSVNRGHMEQRSAAEAAALTAVRDIDRIVINTKQYGWVGIIPVPPTSKSTLAGDNWYCEVRSINDLLATARLDYIIADQMDDGFIKELAYQELQNVETVATQLSSAISASLSKGGSALDLDGNKVSTYDDALASYLNNNAKQSTYKAGTFTLTIGTVSGGISTAVPAPNPTNLAGVNPNQMFGSNYLSDTNLPYKQVNNAAGVSDISTFYLASSGLQTALVDTTKWQAAGANQIASVIKVDADNDFTNQGQTYTQHFMACAVPGADVKRPADGTLSFSFPDGPPPELTAPRDLMSNAAKAWNQFSTIKCDLLSASGDYPTDPGSTISTTPPAGWYQIPKPYPPNASQVNAPDACRIGLYDFLREAGPGVNIQSVVKMLSSNFSQPSPSTTMWNAPDPGIPGKILPLGNIPAGITHIYTINPDGTILYRYKTITPYPYTIAADQQLYTESTSLAGGGIKSKVAKWDLKTKMDIPKNNPPPGPPPKGGAPPPPPLGYTSQAIEIRGNQAYDFYMRDLVHQLGSQQGGKHAGNPMDSSYTARVHKHPVLQIAGRTGQDDFELGGGSTSISPNGQGVPPVVSRQDDFASTSTAPAPPIVMYNSYSSGPDSSGSNARPTYVKNGMSVDLRFRRQVDIGQLSVLYGWYTIGYVGEMDP